MRRDSSPEDIVEHFIALLCASGEESIELQIIYEGHQYDPEQYFLDEIVRNIYWWEEKKDDNLYQKQILDILCKRVKMGDEIIGYGKIDNPIILNNINEFRIRIGGTHAKGGALDELMGELYPEEAAAMRRLAASDSDDDSDYNVP